MHETSYTVAVAAEAEPVTVESLWKIYTEEKLIPMTFKPTGETVFVTLQVSDAIERYRGGTDASEE